MHVRKGICERHRAVAGPKLPLCASATRATDLGSYTLLALHATASSAVELDAESTPTADRTQSGKQLLAQLPMAGFH